MSQWVKICQNVRPTPWLENSYSVKWLVKCWLYTNIGCRFHWDNPRRGVSKPDTLLNIFCTPKGRAQHRIRARRQLLRTVTRRHKLVRSIFFFTPACLWICSSNHQEPPSKQKSQTRSRLFFTPQDYGAFLSTVHCGFLKREKLRANCGRSISGVAAVTGVGLAGAKLGQGFMLSTASCTASAGGCFSPKSFTRPGQLTQKTMENHHF